jgi:MurNAc alpha-1-phosphate uridylyltransferase
MFQVVILAGGLAKRLRPLTEYTPKSLIEINRKPFIDWQLNLLAQKGISEVVLCLSHKSELIENYVGDGSRFNLEVKYSKDGIEQLGTGGAIKNALPFLKDKFMVIYGDSYLDLDYRKAEESFNLCGKPVMMTVYRNQGQYDTSNIKFTEHGIEEYNKNFTKPEFEHIDYGLTFFSKNVFKKLGFGVRFELSDLYVELVKQGKVSGYEVFNRFYEVGSFNGIEDLSKHLIGAQNVL